MNALRRPLSIICWIGYVMSFSPVFAQDPLTLTLDQFLEQVKSQNDNYKAAEAALRAAKLREDEWKLKTRPYLTAGYSQLDDFRESGSFQGDEVHSTTYSFGIEQNFNFGLKATLSYNLQNYDIPALSQVTFPGALPRYSTAGLSLELSQPLWRNFFGSETRADQLKLEALTKAQIHKQTFAQIQILAEAETAYWRLALAREAVAATKESFERAQRLKQWSAERRKLELINRSDFLQADSALLSRQLQLQYALDEEQAAARAFNTMRGVASMEVRENLAPFDAQAISKLQIPERAPFRDDVKAIEYELLSSKAQAKLNVEANKPSLNLKGAVGHQGRDADRSIAMDEGWTNDHPYYSVGVEFRMPIDVITSSRARRAYHQESETTELQLKRRIFEQERLWVDLTRQFNASMNRYKLAAQIEAAQKEKMDYERTRHRRGRTTTYQVIQFEQDYIDAQLARLRAQTEVLNVFAQLKTFRGTP